MTALIRPARTDDVTQMQRIRGSVTENRLVSVVLCERDYVVAITGSGRGWVAQRQGHIVGFAVGNAVTGSVWALFVEPGEAGKGYGRQLQKAMVDWLWQQGHERLWLTTEPGTRAERFYRRAGWMPAGAGPGGEIRLELGRPEAAPRLSRGN